jgi:hypothetical protein
MSVTFGFVTDGLNDQLLIQGIQSIKDARISDYEIIVIGNTSIVDSKVKILKFDDETKPGWITRKKNLLANESTKDVMVILHDYISLGSSWNEINYQSVIAEEWDVAVCKFENLDGSRWCDWHLWPFNTRFLKIPFKYSVKCLLPYNCKNLTNLMYVNGTVIIVRREYFLKNPLDESRVWGQGEDVEWSLRLRDKWKLSFFPDLNVKSLKQKQRAFYTIDTLSLFLVKIFSFVLSILPKSLSGLFRIKYQ